MLALGLGLTLSNIDVIYTNYAKYTIRTSLYRIDIKVDPKARLIYQI